MTYSITARLNYDPPRGKMKRRTIGWCVAELDPEITRYYRWWVQKELWIKIELPSFDAHCSCIRGEYVSKDKLPLWRKYQGKEINLTYDNNIRSNYKMSDDGSTCHYFIGVVSSDIDDLREELGLKAYNRYHITIGKLYY